MMIMMTDPVRNRCVCVCVCTVTVLISSAVISIETLRLAIDHDDHDVVGVTYDVV